jgi:hypothetical protein
VPALREVEPGHLVACHLTAQRQRELWARQVALKTSPAETLPAGTPPAETAPVDTLTGEET